MAFRVAALGVAACIFDAGQAQTHMRGSDAPRLFFKAVGQADRADVEMFLGAELGEHGERMKVFEDALRSLYTSMPKTTEGTLSHQGVRYILHRFFLDRHGWFIRGLEPSHSTWTPVNSQTFVKEWVPSYLQEVLEKRLGEHGAALHDVAAVAAALEDMIKKEAAVRLSTVYQAHELEASNNLKSEEALDILETYYMSFLVANNFTVGSFEELQQRKYRFSKAYRDYDDAKGFFDGVAERHFAGDPEKTYNFEETTAVVTDLSANFFNFNERECSDLKQTLSGMESRKPGRVRLSTFYNMTRYSHWKFTERPEFLRSLGALDESDPKSPSVIITNYAMSRPNCLDAFHLFAICCRNACEDMMGKLEASLGMSEAEPQRISQIVATLPSDTVVSNATTPRTLPPSLLARLDEIAVHHGGLVPIHGRLFAQWMHHAYPLECPFPHEQGTNPQTASEWMEETGATSTDATAEEMRKAVESDECAVDWQGNSGCDHETSELPWSMEERLLLSTAGVHPAALADEEIVVDVGMVIIAIAALAAFGAAGLELRNASAGGGELEAALGEGRDVSGPMAQRVLRAKVACLASLGVFGYSTGLFDSFLVLCFMGLGIVVSLGLAISLKRRPQAKTV